MEHLSDSDDLMPAYYQMFEEEPRRRPPKQARRSNIWSISGSSPLAEESFAGLEANPDWPFEVTNNQSYMEDPQLESFPQQGEGDKWDVKIQRQPLPELTQDGSVDTLRKMGRAKTWSVNP